MSIYSKAKIVRRNTMASLLVRQPTQKVSQSKPYEKKDDGFSQISELDDLCSEDFSDNALNDSIDLNQADNIASNLA